MAEIEDEVIKEQDAHQKPSYQISQYLGACIAIVQAWHQRLYELKNTAKIEDSDANDEGIRDGKSYLAFFRNAISSSDAAKLKRCQHMDDVAMQPAFIALWQQVAQTLALDNMNEARQDNIFAAWLAVAWVLAQVRNVDARYQIVSTGKNKRRITNSLGRIAGQHSDDRPLISPLRFEKLISASNPNHFVSLLARMVGQLQQQGHAVNIVVLANDILHWFTDLQGVNYRSPRDKLVVQWSLAYYQSHNLS